MRDGRAGGPLSPGFARPAPVAIFPMLTPAAPPRQGSFAALWISTDVRVRLMKRPLTSDPREDDTAIAGNAGLRHVGAAFETAGPFPPLPSLFNLGPS